MNPYIKALAIIKYEIYVSEMFNEIYVYLLSWKGLLCRGLLCK